MVPRRVVTGLRAGKSVFISDAQAPNGHIYEGIPGFMTSVVWATPATPLLPAATDEAAPPSKYILPAPGETRLMIVKFPPDSVMAGLEFNPALAAEEMARHVPGLAEKFEAEDPGMHMTDSIDYDIVLDGEIWLELDDGATKLLKTGDVVVQCGTRHAWRNKGQQTATMGFILIGARRL